LKIVVKNYEWMKEIPPTPLSRPGPGSMGMTGRWRAERPVINYEKCKKCGMCWTYCPENAIVFSKDEGPRINYNYCKGCLVCVEECPYDAIKVEREVVEWEK